MRNISVGDSNQNQEASETAMPILSESPSPDSDIRQNSEILQSDIVPTDETESSPPVPELLIEPELSPYEQLWNSISSAEDGVSINISWYNNQTTVFERERDSRVWMIQSRDVNAANAYREVHPTFRIVDGVITVSFTTTTRVYYLLEDGTGHFQNTNGTNNEDLTWDFTIT